MKKTIMVACMLVAVAVQAFPQSKSPALDGVWKGTLKAGEQELHLVLTVKKSSDGSYSAELNSVDQQAVIPVDKITVKGDSVRLDVTSIAGDFQGNFSKDGSELAGTWTQGGTSLPLTFKKETKHS